MARDDEFPGLAHALEKYTAGVEILAEGAGRIRERLLDAYQSQVERAHPPKDLPAEIAERIKGLHRWMTLKHHPARGSYEPSVEAMSEDEAVAMAKEIIETWHLIRRHLDGKG